MIGALLLLAAAAEPAPFPSEFLFARAALGGWRMEAATLVEADGEGRPMIRTMRCDLRGRGLHVTASRSGSLALEIDQPLIALHDIVALDVGGTVYEARTVPSAAPPRRFSDVAYPAGFAQPPAAEPVRRVLAVRRRPAEPFLLATTLVNELLEAGRLTLRYRTAAGEARLTLSAAGLGQALRWCEDAMASDRARRLPAR